ncbi:MAG: APC family permease, partial [Clostridiales bacterium]|nr:APC family permease [Clostridiales bacterium]
MIVVNDTRVKDRALAPYISQPAAWAFSVGTSIGWGALVLTSSSYLMQAGPMGTVLGLVIGGLLMLMVGRNFQYMSGQYPDAGGIYAYTKGVFGYDCAFLVSWFLSLAYIAMFWANATSLPLFARYFMRNAFSFGYMYTVFGYDVYAGEALLTLIAIALVTVLCMRTKRAAANVMVALVCVFTAGIALCSVVAIARHGAAHMSFAPQFVPGRGTLSQTLRMTFISSWAFIGFENITHSAEELKFRTSGLYRILVASVVTSTVLYILVTLMSITAYPEDCANWLDYISRLDSYQGIEGLPAFYAADRYLGPLGVNVLMASLLALVVTSLIGNMHALSRLFYAVARDGILPGRFARLDQRQNPRNAMLLVALLSLPIPFLGRTAIGWIVDVLTIVAALIYGFVSAVAFKTARRKGNRLESFTGLFCLVVMVVFGVYLLFPNVFSDSTLETETYILLIVWSIIGFFYFRGIISKDKARRFGKAIIVWIALLALIVCM